MSGSYFSAMLVQSNALVHGHNPSSTGKSRKLVRRTLQILQSLNPFSGVGPPILITRSIRISSSDEFLRILRPRLDDALERFRTTNRINAHKLLQLESDMAHLSIELIYFTSVSINDPSWFAALEMLKVESTPATVRPSRETAIWLPGHILIDNFSTSRDP